MVERVLVEGNAEMAAEPAVPNTEHLETILACEQAGCSSCAHPTTPPAVIEVHRAAHGEHVLESWGAMFNARLIATVPNTLSIRGRR